MLNFSKKPNPGLFTVLKDAAALDQPTIDLINLAFKHDGYIAGGFARRLWLGTRNCTLLGYPIKPENAVTHMCGDVRSYLGTGKLSGLHMNNSARGDIDLFFQSESGLQSFKADLFDMLSIPPLDPTYVIGTTVVNVFTEIYVSGTTRVQLIAKHVAPIESILSSFDIYNAAVAVNDDHFLVPEGLEALEKEGMLHVFNWTSPMVINRVAKWFWKHNFRKLSPATAGELGSFALRLIEELKERPYQVALGPPIDHTTVIKKLRKLFEALSDDQLLALAPIFPGFNPADTYGGSPDPLTILYRRMKEREPDVDLLPSTEVQSPRVS